MKKQAFSPLHAVTALGAHIGQNIIGSRMIKHPMGMFRKAVLSGIANQGKGLSRMTDNIALGAAKAVSPELEMLNNMFGDLSKKMTDVGLNARKLSATDRQALMHAMQGRFDRAYEVASPMMRDVVLHQVGKFAPQSEAVLRNASAVGANIAPPTAAELKKILSGASQAADNNELFGVIRQVLSNEKGQIVNPRLHSFVQNHSDNRFLSNNPIGRWLKRKGNQRTKSFMHQIALEQQRGQSGLVRAAGHAADIGGNVAVGLLDPAAGVMNAVKRVADMKELSQRNIKVPLLGNVYNPISGPMGVIQDSLSDFFVKRSLRNAYRAGLTGQQPTTFMGRLYNKFMGLGSVGSKYGFNPYTDSMQQMARDVGQSIVENSSPQRIMEMLILRNLSRGMNREQAVAAANAYLTGSSSILDSVRGAVQGSANFGKRLGRSVVRQVGDNFEALGNGLAAGASKTTDALMGLMPKGDPLTATMLTGGTLLPAIMGGSGGR